MSKLKINLTRVLLSLENVEYKSKAENEYYLLRSFNITNKWKLVCWPSSLILTYMNTILFFYVYVNPQANCRLDCSYRINVVNRVKFSPVFQPPNIYFKIPGMAAVWRLFLVGQWYSFVHWMSKTNMFRKIIVDSWWPFLTINKKNLAKWWSTNVFCVFVFNNSVFPLRHSIRVNMY